MKKQNRFDPLKKIRKQERKLTEDDLRFFKDRYERSLKFGENAAEKYKEEIDIVEGILNEQNRSK